MTNRSRRSSAVLAAALVAAAVALSPSRGMAEWTGADDEVVNQLAGVLVLARTCDKLDRYGPVLSKVYAQYIAAHAATSSERKHATDVAIEAVNEATDEAKDNPNRQLYCLMADGIVLNFLRQTASADDTGTDTTPDTPDADQ
ncbi:MAG TPA: hypothetical protein VMQ73_14060 [Methylomirabilota bacterium]|nr:hypothetical protein [Methylomirabilota bacterium]